MHDRELLILGDVLIHFLAVLLDKSVETRFSFFTAPRADSKLYSRLTFTFQCISIQRPETTSVGNHSRFHLMRRSNSGKRARKESNREL